MKDKENDKKTNEALAAIVYFIKDARKKSCKDLYDLVYKISYSDLSPLLNIMKDKEIMLLLTNNFSEKFIRNLLIFLSYTYELIGRIDHNHIKDINYSDILTNK